MSESYPEHKAAERVLFAILTDYSKIYRHGRSKRWFREYPPELQKAPDQLTAQGAAEIAIGELGNKVFMDGPGGQQFRTRIHRIVSQDSEGVLYRRFGPQIMWEPKRR